MIRTIFASSLVVLAAGTVMAQIPAPARTPAQPASPTTAAATAHIDTNAAETREELRQLMQRFPPDLGRILRMDPSLLQSKEYLSQYPALAAFVATHPEIVHNPGYYFEFVRDRSDWNQPSDARSQTVAMWRNAFESLGVFSIFLTVSLLIAWFIRTFIDYRRWLRVSRVQTEVHNKLLERFAGSGELLAYVQSPAGRRFLESAPIPLDPGPRSVAAPFGRILWSVQAGVVFTVVGLGLQIVSGRVIEEIGQPLALIGVLAMALGVGFILSGAVSYVLSRRLGLLEPVMPPAPERPDSSSV